MQRILLLVGAFVSLGAFACSDGGVPAAPGGDLNRIPPIVGSGGTGGGGAGGSGGGGSGGSGGSESQGACDNTLDEEVLASLSGDPIKNARGVSAECAIAQCSNVLGQGEATFVECVTSCIDREVPALSPGCNACYGALAWCAQLLCNTACANDPCSEQTCLNCTQGANYQACLATLDVCAGRPSLDCQ